MSARSLQIILPESMADEIDRAVRDGQYPSANDALVHAVEQWQASRLIEECDAEFLRRAWDEGIASGPSQPWDVEAFLKTAKARFKAGKAS